MNTVHLDLNLLRVLDVLLEERSVTRAGARLGLSQSAVSHALNRLRYVLQDELFLRRPSGMEPTRRALEMGPQVHAALNQLQLAVAPADFAPATTERRFTLAAGAYSCAVLVPPVVGRMAVEAPHAELAIAEQTADLVERMDARRVDFMVGGVADAPDRFTRETILTEALAWVVRAEHHLASANAVDMEALVSTPHVVIARGGLGQGADSAGRRDLVSRASWEDGGALEAALAAHRLVRRVGVTVPDTYSAIAVASRTDMAALIPRRLALMSAQGGRLKLIEPPYASPAVEVNLLFLRERLAEPAIAWMRELIHTAAAAL